MNILTSNDRTQRRYKQQWHLQFHSNEGLFQAPCSVLGAIMENVLVILHNVLRVLILEHHVLRVLIIVVLKVLIIEHHVLRERMILSGVQSKP